MKKKKRRENFKYIYYSSLFFNTTTTSHHHIKKSFWMLLIMILQWLSTHYDFVSFFSHKYVRILFIISLIYFQFTLINSNHDDDDDDDEIFQQLIFKSINYFFSQIKTISNSIWREIMSNIHLKSLSKASK